MNIRKWHVTRALESAVLLAEMLPELTEEEVLYCLDLEAGSRRRRTLIECLINRAARFNRQRYITQLKEKHHVSSPVENPVGR